jgi:hypothetical protein
MALAERAKNKYIARPVCWLSLSCYSVPTLIFAETVCFFANILQLKGAEHLPVFSLHYQDSYSATSNPHLFHIEESMRMVH